MLFALIINCIMGLFQGPKLPESKHRFLVIAHRGDHNQVPENTLESFQNAISSGLDYVEIDLRTTKDSVLIIMHDDTVDRMTNGKGRVSDHTYAEIRNLRIKSNNADSNTAYSVPAFSDVLQMCRHKIHIYLDFKNASVKQTYALIKQFGMENDVIVYINAAYQYSEWRNFAPGMPLMLSLPRRVKTREAWFEFLKQTPVSVLDGNYLDYNEEVLKAVSESGIPAWPDIQSQAEAGNWEKAVSMGFKGLQTDHPEELIKWLEKKGLR